MTRKFKKRPRVEVIFDENDRRDFLTGFKKRKQERREKALKKFEGQVKNERNKLRKKKRDASLGVISQLQPHNALFCTVPNGSVQQQQQSAARHTQLANHTVSVTPIDIWQHSPANLLWDTGGAAPTTVESSVETCDADQVPGMSDTCAQSAVESQPSKATDTAPVNVKLIRTNERLLRLKNAKKTQRTAKRRKHTQKKLTKKSHQLKKMRH